MGYEALIQVLLAEGEAKAREIEARADEAERDLVRRAAEEADGEVTRRTRAAALERDRERREVLGGARARARAIVASARDAAVVETFAAAARRLDAVSTTAAYRACLGRLADEALADLPHPVVVVVDERDAEVWRPLLTGRGLEPIVAARPDLRCGLEAESADGRVRHRNSFRSRLEHAKSRFVIELVALWSSEPATGAGGA